MDDDDEFLERIDRMINDYATNRRDRQVSDGRTSFNPSALEEL